MRILSILLALTLLSCTKQRALAPAQVEQRVRLTSQGNRYQRLNFPEFTPQSTVVVGKKIAMCPRKVTVAVVDTGIDYTHRMLVNFILKNPRESLNGLDNDQNGFPEDVMGWDFVNDVNHPYDTHGHGTHISGIIAGLARNANGEPFYETPICTPDVKILPLKYYDNSGSGHNTLQNTVRAFDYAIAKKVDIINYSSGGAAPAPPEKEVIDRARKAGILVITAAGNDGHNNNFVPYYPGSYLLDNEIMVASLDRDGALLPSSNFGTTVPVAAPGLALLSTLPYDKLGSMSGTSQAAAYVSRLAVILTSMDTTFNYRRVKAAILNTAVPLKNLHKSLGYGIVDPQAAIRSIVQTSKVKVR